MNDSTAFVNAVPAARKRELIEEGERLLAQARAIRALAERLVLQGDEHAKRMYRFKDGRDLNRAEAMGDPMLSTLLYAVCREGEALRTLLHGFTPRIRDPRT
jgi:hypothetical protein